MTYRPAAGEDDRVALYGGPSDGALAVPARPDARVITVRGELYRRTIASNRDGRPIFQHTPASATPDQGAQP